MSDAKGRVDWVASFPDQNGIQAVPTSVAIGPDGAYYVGELTGFPAPLGASRVWRVAPGTRCRRLRARLQRATGNCQTVVSGIPILTSIAFRGSTLWGSILALVPGQADVVPLN